MKLASLKDGTRDGRLSVVSRDLKKASFANHIAATMQCALDNWALTAPKLQQLYEQINEGKAPYVFDFDPKHCMAPLPRAFQWVDSSAYLNLASLMYKAQLKEIPTSLWLSPLMYQGGSDDFIGPKDDIKLMSENWDLDFEGELAVIIDDVQMGTMPEHAGSHIKLLMLVNDLSLRSFSAAELSKGLGPIQCKPMSSFSPVAVTPDELGTAWHDNKAHLPMRVTWNGELIGQPHTGTDMVFDFSQLISHLTKTRNARAGSIIGSGTISNKDSRNGYASIIEKRYLEIIADGEAKTRFMKFGDSIHIEMIDDAGNSIFGAIDQKFMQG